MEKQQKPLFIPSLLADVHHGLVLPSKVAEKSLVCGKYLYYHYMCDAIDDRGWGCGYRTLQTLMSWLQFQEEAKGKETLRVVPTLREIQEALVKMEDKSPTFLGSREWIGSVELSMCIDYFYEVPCKIVHISSGSLLQEEMKTFQTHFQEMGSPVMMGGDVDASSKCILGTCKAADDSYLLVLDPHFSEKTGSPQKLQDLGWIKWMAVTDFSQSSFYNLCLPQYKAAS